MDLLLIDTGVKMIFILYALSLFSNITDRTRYVIDSFEAQVH